MRLRYNDIDAEALRLGYPGLTGFPLGPQDIFPERCILRLFYGLYLYEYMYSRSAFSALYFPVVERRIL